MDSSTRQLVLISLLRFQETLSQKEEEHTEGTLEADFRILYIHVYLHTYTYTHEKQEKKEEKGKKKSCQ